MRTTRLITPLIAGIAVLTACSDASGPPLDAIDAYIKSLGPWGAYAPLVPASDVATGDSSTRMETIERMIDGVPRDITYACVSTPHSLTDTPREIVMYEPNASIMWVGNLIQGSSYKGGQGTFQELSIRQRAPVRLSIDLLTGGNFAVVDQPSLTTIQSAIGELIQHAQDAGHRAGSSIQFDAQITHATHQAALKLGMSAHFLGSSVHAALNVQRNAAQRTLIAHFVQKMFTIAIELPQSAGAFFTDDFTETLLNDQIVAGNIGPNNLPVYLASVTYGRTLTYALTSTYSEERMRAAISASFNGLIGGGSGYTETELRETLSQDNIKLVAIGGEGQNVLALISQGNLKAYFAYDAPLTTAKPISYQLNYLGDNRLARVSESTSYLHDTCVEVPSGDVISDFEVDDEEWSVEGGTTSEARVGGRDPVDGERFIRADDGGPGTMYFRAPGKFRGDKSAYYGGNLSFFVRWLVESGFGNGSPLASADVILIGANGVTLTYRFGRDDWPEDQWDFRQVAIDVSAPWRMGTALATEQQLRDVLANVLQLKIRGEYRGNVTDIGFLDRVILSQEPAP